ncbi:hypothetical protein [Pseudonocardia sp. D17]|uniref:hypothetical protein n=1 Tax=Pseudonocardia sp. D17 TaxID=882661 RepID=UPI002B3EBF57|nr:hypothetical protein PSD17_55530 [Pseudonocardia sp. D17]
MRLVTLDVLKASHGPTHEQYVDANGTAWICTSIKGWLSAPARRTKHDERPTGDGAHRSAAYRETRSMSIEGRFFPLSDAVGWDTADRLLAICPDPGERYPMVVDGAVRPLLAYVEQAGEVLVDQTGPRQWDWSVPVIAADPYRYSVAWASVGPSSAGTDGVGGIATSGSGIVTSSPGIATGTAPTLATATVTGTGTVDSQVVYQVTGPTAGVQVADLAGTSIVGVRGNLAAGESLFINTSGRVAFDVPGCPTPIPAYGAVLGGANARGAVWVTGGWPRLRPGEIRTYRLTGATGAGTALTVHTRGTWV